MWHDIDIEAIDRRLMEDVVGDILNTKLSERERTVIVCRFWGEMTLQKTAEYCGVTRERVRQNECKAFRKLLKDDVVEIFAKCGVLAAEKEKKKRVKEKEQLDLENAKIYAKMKRKSLVKTKDSRPIILDFKPREIKAFAPVVPPEHRVPPRQVKLKYTEDGCPYLWLDPVYGTIERHKNPHVYQAWLDWLEKYGNDSLASRPELVFLRL